MTWGACISNEVCVPSLHHNKFSFHLRFCSTSVDFKIGTFTSFTPTLDMALLFCSLSSNACLSSSAYNLRFNLFNTNPASSTLLLLVPTSALPTDFCGVHLNCIVVLLDVHPPGLKGISSPLLGLVQLLRCLDRLIADFGNPQFGQSFHFCL